ncbi:MAG: hypothetical protein QXN56_01365 [Candidatus Hadarchaeum sp.]
MLLKCCKGSAAETLVVGTDRMARFRGLVDSPLWDELLNEIAGLASGRGMAFGLGKVSAVQLDGGVESRSPVAIGGEDGVSEFELAVHRLNCPNTEPMISIDGDKARITFIFFRVPA